MRTIKLVLEYDGSGFAGWQAQSDMRTVQGELTRAVERMVNHAVEVAGAGRTDRGVHAAGQAASFSTASTIPPRGFLAGLNRYLPRDVAVVGVEEASADFHARRSAIGKHYRYSFLLSATRSALAGRWTSLVRGALDVEAMRRAGRLLEGEHDFAAFATRSRDRPASTVKTLHLVGAIERAPFVFVDVVGSGFLYNMVRTIAGTLLDVGRGKRRAGEIEEILRSRDRRRAGPTAEARGLCLREVFYDRTRLEAAVAGLLAGGSGSGDVGVSGRPGMTIDSHPGF
jgi:tRNA pseudouridine38-40 synthase